MHKKIVVEGICYVGLSLVVIYSQHNESIDEDIVLEKVEMIVNRKSPIWYEYIEKYLSEKTEKSRFICNARRRGVYKGQSLL